VDLRPFGSIAIGLLAWELGVRLFVRGSLFIVPPSAVGAAFVRLINTGEFQTHFGTSALEFLVGFVIASVIGIALGIAMAASDNVRAYVDPWVSALYSTPLLAITPLMILVFGLGVSSKIIIVFLVSVFVIVINTYTGLLHPPAQLVEAARSFGASRQQVFTKVRIPAAIPVIIAGERIAVGRAIAGVVIAELFGAQAGLGYLIQRSSQVFDTAALFVGVVALAAVGIALVETLKLIEARLTPWQTPDSGE
jgi:ABC-type nitrate/sulfonate/bicarbonate transport system permease component